jgi:cold shock CspA family protein
MAKSKVTTGKKEKEKKRLQQRREKEQKMQERKSNTSKGKSWEDMIAWTDENGNLTDTPPNPNNKKTVRAEDIQIQVVSSPKEDMKQRQGRVDFFNHERGFGFIIDNQSKEKLFFHVNNLQEEVAENDQVIYNIERGERGMVAAEVMKFQSTS